MVNPTINIVVFVLVLVLVLLFLAPLPWKGPSVCRDVHPSDEETYTHIYHGDDPLHRDFNPSLVKLNTTSGDNYLCSLRRSNIGISDLFSTLLNAQQGFASHLYLMRFNNSFQCIKDSETKIDVVVSGKDRRFEDPRIILYKDKIYLVAAYYYSNIRVSPVILQLNKESLKVERTIDLWASNLTTTEKNWCPFIHGDSFFLHTDSYPIWKVREVDLNTGTVRTIVEQNVFSLFSKEEYPSLRCSSSWELTKEGYLCALHTKTKGLLPTYRTVLVLVDKKTLLPIAKSKKLCLDTKHHRIQFTSGLIVKNDEVYVALGLADLSFSIVKIKDWRKLLL